MGLGEIFDMNRFFEKLHLISIIITKKRDPIFLPLFTFDIKKTYR